MERSGTTPLHNLLALDPRGRILANALAIFPNRTHLIPYDDTEQFNGTVDRFLATPFKKIDLIPQTMGSLEKMMSGLAH